MRVVGLPSASGSYKNEIRTGLLKRVPSGVSRNAVLDDASSSVLLMGLMPNVVSSSTAPGGISIRTISPYNRMPPLGPIVAETASPTGCPLGLTTGSPKTGSGSSVNGASLLQEAASKNGNINTNR